MKHTREEIYVALFDLVKVTPGLVTASRITRLFTDISPEQQPALFMEQVRENPIYKGRGISYAWELDVVLGLYVYSGDENSPVEAQLNPIMDAIEEVLAPPHAGPQTLGGLAIEVRLFGEDKAASGSLGPQAWSFMPVRIVAA